MSLLKLIKEKKKKKSWTDLAVVLEWSQSGTLVQKWSEGGFELIGDHRVVPG